MRVWGIFYELQDVPKGSWTGPCGIYGMTFRDKLSPLILDGFCGRPVFFRTRKLAREEVVRLIGENRNRISNVKYKVEPFDLRWEKLYRRK